VYLITMASLVFTAYYHLDYAADGLGNVSWQTLVDAFPIFFLFISIFFFLASISLMRWRGRLAAKLGMAASICAWLYYGLINCAMLLAFALLPLFHPLGIIVFGLPIILLYFSYTSSWQLLRRIPPV
jgi:hypothetical protein